MNKILRDSWKIGLPVFSHVYPFGQKVSKDRFDMTVEMSVSMGLESGVDGVFIPGVSTQTYKNISKFCSIPFFIWCKNPELPVADLLKSVKHNVRGFVFGKEFFINHKFLNYIKKINES